MLVGRSRRCGLGDNNGLGNIGKTECTGDGEGSERGRTVASTETGGDDLDLSLIRTWGPEGTWFITEIFGAVENGGVLCLERRRHDRGDGKSRIKLTTASTVFKVSWARSWAGPCHGPTCRWRGWMDRDGGISRHNRDNHGVPLPRVGQSQIPISFGRASGAKAPVPLGLTMGYTPAWYK